MMDLMPSQMGQLGYEINDMAHLSKGQGPPGSNLFIFHLPNEWSNSLYIFLTETIYLFYLYFAEESDLHMVFQIYGNILSSRIMTDKETKKSKGYGFISYDNPTSAMQAMQNMNGYQANSSNIY
jgi:CUG-BP- and ETR3-like factor